MVNQVDQKYSEDSADQTGKWSSPLEYADGPISHFASYRLTIVFDGGCHRGGKRPKETAGGARDKNDDNALTAVRRSCSVRAQAFAFHHEMVSTF
jgi:hypothetical protein